MKPLFLARWIITECDQSISNLELQKILWCLELKHRVEYGKPLLDGEYTIKGDQTLTLGIVNEEIYQKYRNYGSSSIDCLPMSFKEKMGVYRPKRAGYIAWIDHNIHRLRLMSYFTLSWAMLREGGLLKKRQMRGDFSRISSADIDIEAQITFGKNGLLTIEKPRYSTDTQDLTRKDIIEKDELDQKFIDLLLIGIYAFLIYSACNIFENSLVIAFLQGLGVIE